MVDVRNQIEDYLNLLNMKYYWNEEKGFFELVFIERKNEQLVSESTEDDSLSFKYTVFIKPGLKWIQIYSDVYPLDKISPEKKQTVILDLLHCNRKYAEVCFDLDKSRGIIGTSQELMIRGLNFDLFREEFLAVPWTVKKFWTEIAAKHGLE
ncbi:MAG: hypothetical protein ACFFCX_06515 [Candidatus Sifarchaeia archaeon]